ncbi:MAG: HAD family hydrolase [Candidatus Komeilibacteria bacterium]|nr:HAD family hydrolase [Candidatus Komeilibacteria bacterium]
MNKLVLFDIDGTLVTGKTGHKQAFINGFKEVFGLETELDWDTVQGMTDQQIITTILLRHGFLEEEIKRKMLACLAVMEKSFQESILTSEVKILGGVVELLTNLKAKNYLLGLVTGNLIKIARIKLGKVGLWDFFDVGGFGSDDIYRSNLVKLAIQRAGEKHNFVWDKNVILFGDTPLDVKAGQEAGVATIGVTTGVHTRKNLEDIGAGAVVDSLEDTDDILKLINSIYYDDLN